MSKGVAKFPIVGKEVTPTGTCKNSMSKMEFVETEKGVFMTKTFC